MRTTPPPSSSGEFWAMCECTTQRIDVGDKGSFAVKPVRGNKKRMYLQKEAMANTCASSRGKT